MVKKSDMPNVKQSGKKTIPQPTSNTVAIKTSKMAKPKGSKKK